jgi:hypothetical protein
MLETCGSAGKRVYLPGDRVESQAMTGVGELETERTALTDYVTGSR